jgi:hypothetical protein
LFISTPETELPEIELEIDPMTTEPEEIKTEQSEPPPTVID